MKFMITHPPTDANFGHAKTAAGELRLLSQLERVEMCLPDLLTFSFFFLFVCYKQARLAP